MLKKFVMLSTWLLSASAWAQSPALGPPVPAPGLPACNATRSNAPCIAELGAFVFTAGISGQTQLTVNSTNANLASQGKSARVSLEGIDQWKPRRIQTQAFDQPNSWRVLVPYGIDLKVSIPWAAD